MKQINWDVTKRERKIIIDIVKRTMKMADGLDIHIDFLTMQMDLIACHKNGNKLRLAHLLNADDLNFSHDVFGIRRHINRDTGELQNFFVPRFSA